MTLDPSFFQKTSRLVDQQARVRVRVRVTVRVMVRVTVGLGLAPGTVQ